MAYQKRRQHGIGKGSETLKAHKSDFKWEIVKHVGNNKVTFVVFGQERKAMNGN